MPNPNQVLRAAGKVLRADLRRASLPDQRRDQLALSRVLASPESVPLPIVLLRHAGAPCRREALPEA